MVPCDSEISERKVLERTVVARYEGCRLEEQRQGRAAWELLAAMTFTL